MGSKIYDDWERLVDAVLRREQLREMAMCSSKETSSIDDESSCFSNDVDWSDIASSSSTIDGSFRFSFSSTSLFSEHSIDVDTALPTDPEISYEALPKFEEVSDSEKPELFIKKMNMCCVTFDFTDPTKNLKEKEIKRQTLLELFNYAISADRKFTENVMEAFVEMVSVNIFRDFTPQPRGSKPVDAVSLEEDDPINPSRTHWMLIVDHALREEQLVAFDHAWLHLQTVYEFFLRFVVSEQTDAKVAKGYIDLTFIQKLINLFDSEDPRERIYLKNILENIYRKFIMHRRSIRRAINNVFYHFIYETKMHNGITELLKILGNIISGFILPLKEEHEISLVRALIPLHKPKCLAKYHEQLSYCIVEFVKKEPKLACVVIKGLIRYWPITNSLKEVLFLDELENVLNVTQQTEFQQGIVPLFNQVSRSLSSSHSGVAERAAMFCQDNDYIVTLIKQNYEVILPIIFPALERSARDHWNQECRVLTLKVRNYFYDLNPDRFQDDESKEYENKVKSEANSNESSSDESDYGIGPAIPPPRDTNMFHKLKQMSTHTYLEFEFNHAKDDYEVFDVHDLRKTNRELRALNESVERKLAERELKIEKLQMTIKEMYEWNKMLEKEEEAKRESSNKVIIEELRRSRMKLRVMYILFMVLLYFLFSSGSIYVTLTIKKLCKVRYQGDILTLDG